MAQVVGLLPCKHEDLSSILPKKKKNVSYIFYNILFNPIYPNYYYFNT
jgi:hypothetical protein